MPFTVNSDYVLCGNRRAYHVNCYPLTRPESPLVLADIRHDAPWHIQLLMSRVYGVRQHGQRLDSLECAYCGMPIVSVPPYDDGSPK